MKSLFLDLFKLIRGTLLVFLLLSFFLAFQANGQVIEIKHGPTAGITYAKTDAKMFDVLSTLDNFTENTVKQTEYYILHGFRSSDAPELDLMYKDVERGGWKFQAGYFVSLEAPVVSLHGKLSTGKYSALPTSLAIEIKGLLAPLQIIELFGYVAADEWVEKVLASIRLGVGYNYDKSLSINILKKEKETFLSYPIQIYFDLTEIAPFTFTVEGALSEDKKHYLAFNLNYIIE